MKSTICIMADFGNGPYAWLRGPELAPPRVGGNIADSVSGFPEDFGISQQLQIRFADWVTDFEREWENTHFEWEQWNQTGIALSRELKREVGDQYFVEYHYPCEDPKFGGRANRVEVIE